MMVKEIAITPKTLIPLSGFGAVLGLVFAVATVFADVNALKDEQEITKGFRTKMWEQSASVQLVMAEIKTAKVFRNKMWEQQVLMDRRLARMEGKILEIVVGGD